ncbi:putative ferric-chelate reductase 1 homolog [Daphnia carinata]|uniref:putative ferric-chelate reductase 1 homolog n=1 Tax=Daphnia carinata TaxID=120202 RepID=UPI00257C577B|nr:putative ferric-chelate reductase 1 homolog [Daphnia carinata]
MNYYLLFWLMALAQGSPYGAPQSACATMMPGHGFNPQNGTSPFIVIPLTSDIMQNSFVPIGLSSLSSDDFKGFLIMAFSNSSRQPIGKFSIEADGQSMSCFNGTDNAATHSINNDKSWVMLNWMPPYNFVGSVRFRTTFVKNASHYWVGIESDPVEVIPLFIPSSAGHFSPSLGLALLILIVGMF